MLCCGRGLSSCSRTCRQKPRRWLAGRGATDSRAQQRGRTLVFCGYSHWPTIEPQVLANGSQVLNADSNVFILARA